MNKKTCILAINMPDLEKWIQGINREGGLSKVPIWEELHVADVLQDPKDVVPSLENNYPDILFVSNRFDDIDGLKATLEKCKRSYSHVRVIVLLWTKTPEQAASAQEILHFCLHHNITTDIVYGKISVSTIKNALDNPISRKEAESYKDPNYVFQAEPAKPEVKEEPAPPKRTSLFEKIKPRLVPSESKAEPAPAVSDVIPPSEEPRDTLTDRTEHDAYIPKVKPEPSIRPESTQPEDIAPKSTDPTVQQQERPAVGSKIHDVFKHMDASDADVKNDFELGVPPKAQEPDKSMGQDAEQPRNKLSDIVKRTKNIVQLGGTSGKTPTTPPMQNPSSQLFQPYMPPNVPIASTVPIGAPQFINAKVITFYSPNSIGKTMTLCNMAAYAASIGLKPIAIDMNVLKHDLGAYFGLPRKTMGLEQAVYDGIDDMSLRALITTKYGVDIIPIGMERARYDIGIEPAQVNQILNIVARRMDYNLIFMDTCNIIDEAATATVLMQSDIIYLIVDQNRSFLEDIYNELIFAEEVMNLPRSKFRLVINNYVEKCDMSQSRIENYLHMKAVAVIPADRPGHLQAVNNGKPYCLIEPDSSEIWSRLISNAIGRTLEAKSGMLGKIGKIFK